MALGDHRGRARLDTQNPTAMGCCDRCGFWYALDQLQRQFEWRGAALADTGFLVCAGAGTKNCLDVPFEQNRLLILPPDPVPRRNPRPDYNVTGTWQIGQLSGPTTPGNQGFTQYVLGAPGQPYPAGNPNVPNYPTVKSQVLEALAQFSGIPTPGSITDRSVVLSPANTTVSVMAANPSRAWLAIYSPVQPPAFISKGTALLGAATNLAMGPGQCWFWATAQGLGTVYQGALTAIGLTSGMPLWAWEG